MSLKAYQNTQRLTESPRDTEFRLFGKVTGALMDARGAAPTDRKLIEALAWNRRVWSSLAADCASEGNQLPADLRANFISLSLWVNRYSSEVMRKKADIEPLIDVNKAIMEGLKNRSE